MSFIYNQDVQARNWNMESELDSDVATRLETGFTFQFPPEYEFEFTCSIKDPTQNQVLSAQITPETLTFGARENGETYEFEFDRLRKTFTSESHALSVEVKESLTTVFETMFDFTPLVEGKEVVLGQAIDRPVNIFGIDGNVKFKPFKFVKFNGMTGLKSHYEITLSGNARMFGESLGYLQMTGRGWQ